MSPAKKTSGRKKGPARSTSSSKSSKRGSAKKATARKKTTAKKSARKATARRGGKTTARKKTSAKKTAAKKTSKRSAKKSTRKAAKKTAKRATAKKSTAKKPPAKKTARKKPTAKETARKPTAGKSTTRRPPAARAAATQPKPTRPRVRAAKFDRKQLAEIRGQLEGQRRDLQAQLEELTADSFDATQSDMTGEVGLDDDFADAGSATFERERDLSIQNNIRDLIDQTSRAMQRIDDGNYGTCERCGNPIEAARLKALPHALLCMDCKRREERAR
jgi:RNA polymerase-binding protein DksA